MPGIELNMTITTFLVKTKRKGYSQITNNKDFFMIICFYLKNLKSKKQNAITNGN